MRIQEEDNIQKVNDSLALNYPMVLVNWFDNPKTDITTFNCQIRDPSGKPWFRELPIDNYSIVRESQPFELLTNAAYTTIEELINSVPVDKIGLYPFARIWYDVHYPEKSKLLWNPDRDVPGYVFSRAYKTYPRDKGKATANYNITLNIDRSVLNKVEEVSQQQELQEIREAINMAATAKKKVIKRAPIQGFDPGKVKSPECVNHKEPMIFDKVEQKWRCPVDGCKVVARPKRDEDDKTVILGKGGLQLRLVAEDDKRSVVLISDDNVALNITKFVDLDEIIERFDVMDQAKVASSNGKENIATPTDKTIGITMRLVIMGTTDLTE